MTAKVRLGASYWKLWTASVVSNFGDGIAIVAYPWLASAVTRNPILLAGIALVQRLPWLVFTLPAGVITDRSDRRKIIMWMDVVRFGITLLVALAVFAGQGDLPAIVEPEALETANGRLWSAEMVMNSFVGPPLGGVLIGAAFALPFFVDAGTFAVAAGLVFLLTGEFRARRNNAHNAAPGAREKVEWRKEIGEGVRWLWKHPLLRPMAIVLGLMNGLGQVVFATFVFFAQEVLEVNATVFGLLGTGAAIGGVIGGVLGPRVSRALGSGPSLYLTMLGGAATALIAGVSSQWPIVWLMMLIGTFTAVLWNVITVSLRQTIIPDELLGRVNSVYRFFGWGMMPIGALLGGIVVAVTDAFASRELALRMPWIVEGIAMLFVFVYAAPRLTTAKIEAARAEGAARRPTEEGDSAEGARVSLAETGVDGAPPPEDD